jgi:hypothetical protein
VVAQATRSTAPERAAAQRADSRSAVRLALRPAPALRVRDSVLTPPVRAAPRTPPPAASAKPAITEPQATTPQPTVPQTTTPVRTQPTTPSPKQVAPKRPVHKAPQKRPSGPDFDETGPQAPPGGSG